MKNQKMTDAYKNAIGTVFLLAGAFFICSTLLSMRTVLADPIAPVTATNSSLSPARVAAARNKSNVRNTGVSRSTIARPAATKSTGATDASGARNIKTRSVSVRSNNGRVKSVSQSSRSNNTSNRSIVSRTNAGNNTTMRGIAARNTGRVVARNASNASRVSLIGTGMRYSTGTSIGISNLTSKLYTGNYSNIIDSTTGLISAEAYSNCMESYYTCMDEICTARSDTKGRCSCAGRATNFLSAETALEKANEELISLSGQLALLISTKGKDVSEAFKLTDAEKVMNCVSYKDAKEVAGTTKDSSGNTISNTEYMKSWCRSHMMYNESECSYNKTPAYCSSTGEGGNNFGFDISNIDGSSSDILASLKAWADAKDLAKNYTVNDTENLLETYGAIAGVVNGLSGVTSTDLSQAELDGLANTWGYELFQYAHNNVCGRVLDSCFNGIYEACGTPPTVKVNNSTGGTTTATMCANNATSNCPFNYNSKVEIASNGEVTLNERGAGNATIKSSASCFGYSTTATSSSDPYATLRGPVADARRSIMQKYLLDANAACDTYGATLKNTAQNINYQKIAAEQALRQKRLDFYNEEEEKVETDAIAAMNNFNECISEIWDCYATMADEEPTWTNARIKTYCAQVANVPHCYETMVCSTPGIQFKAIVDESDSKTCKFSLDRKKNTCRNIVTLNEILYNAANNVGTISYSAIVENMNADGEVTSMNSAELREGCIVEAIGCSPDSDMECLRRWQKQTSSSNSGN